MNDSLTPADYLIVSADFQPDPKADPVQGRDWSRTQVLRLADKLAKTGVYIKVNSIQRASGNDLARQLKSRGLKTFLDYKLLDIPETLGTDGLFLNEVQPDIVTVACVSGVVGMKALKAKLPNTQVLGVSILTNLTETDCQDIYTCSVAEAMFRLSRLAMQAGLDGLICSGAEVEMLRADFGPGKLLVTPGIRPTCFPVQGDDQNPDRVMTPEKVIKIGANKIVIGRPIIRAENPRDAVMRILDEINDALAKAS